MMKKRWCGALLALALVLTLLPTVVFAADEQFSLTPGGTYYFDLSGEEIPGTVNTGNDYGAPPLPDKSLHYIPFTYVGTIKAYKLTQTKAITENEANKEAYDHSLFIADHVVKHTVSWDTLNEKSLIFGKSYTSGGVDYTLRAPSVGSYFTGSGDSQRGTPTINEWDTILNKNSGYIKNWTGMASLGQDTNSNYQDRRVDRGFFSARNFRSNSSGYNDDQIAGFRPVLEIQSSNNLTTDGLKVVTLDLKNAPLSGSREIKIVVKNDSEFTAPASKGLTVPAGYTLKWTDSDGNTYAPSDPVPKNVTSLKAELTPNTYTVTLNANGGTINSGDITSYTYGVGATLPTNVTKTGYTFGGWYSNNKKVTAIGQTETGNKSFTARWQANTYNITYELDGGTNHAGNPATYTYGAGVPELKAPTKTGYDFLGWYFGDTPVTSIGTSDIGDKSFIAKWQASTYTVTLNLDGGTINSGNVTEYTYGVGATLPTDVTRAGYTFGGWYDNEDFSGDAVTAISDTDSGAKTFYAKWMPVPYYPPSYAITVEKAEHGSVTVSPKSAAAGATVTVTVTPDEGYTPETLTVTDKDGKALTLTDRGGGKYTFPMPSGSVTVKATFMDDNTMLNFFTDVKPGDYFYDAVLWAAKNGITSGTDAVHFSPNLPCTRGQIVTFLWRAAGSPVVNYAMDMSDISEGSYYAEAVRWALSLGITTGTGADAFSPDAPCTRAQAVTFLARARNAKASGGMAVREFADFDRIPAYAVDAIQWALENNVTTGTGDAAFSPDEVCTRAQIVTFLYRAFS